MSVRNLGLTQINASRPAAATGSPPQPGSRGVTQYYAGNEIIRMPSGSIVSIPPLESVDLAQARLKEAILLALPFGLFLWICIALVIRALFF